MKVSVSEYGLQSIKHLSKELSARERTIKSIKKKVKSLAKKRSSKASKGGTMGSSGVYKMFKRSKTATSIDFSGYKDPGKFRLKYRPFSPSKGKSSPNGRMSLRFNSARRNQLKIASNRQVKSSFMLKSPKIAKKNNNLLGVENNYNLKIRRSMTPKVTSSINIRNKFLSKTMKMALKRHFVSFSKRQMIMEEDEQMGSQRSWGRSSRRKRGCLELQSLKEVSPRSEIFMKEKSVENFFRKSFYAKSDKKESKGTSLGSGGSPLGEDASRKIRFLDSMKKIEKKTFLDSRLKKETPKTLHYSFDPESGFLGLRGSQNRRKSQNFGFFETHSSMRNSVLNWFESSRIRSRDEQESTEYKGFHPWTPKKPIQEIIKNKRKRRKLLKGKAAKDYKGHSESIFHRSDSRELENHFKQVKKAQIEMNSVCDFMRHMRKNLEGRTDSGTKVKIRKRNFIKRTLNKLENGQILKTWNPGSIHQIGRFKKENGSKEVAGGKRRPYVVKRVLKTDPF